MEEAIIIDRHCSPFSMRFLIGVYNLRERILTWIDELQMFDYKKVSRVDEIPS